MSVIKSSKCGPTQQFGAVLEIGAKQMNAIANGFKSRLGRMLAVLFALVLAAPLAIVPASAQTQIAVIRDAEIETMIADFAAPLLKAAGLPTKPKVYIVSDRSFNAFVIEDGSIFVNYGTLIAVENANEFKAVLAHEIGHVAGGHLARIREQMDINASLQILAIVLGAGSAVASSMAGGPQLGGVATAFVLASQSAGQNSLLAFRRSEESAADAAALKFLERTGQSGRGMVQVLQYLKAEESAGYSKYVRTHPEASQRVEQVEVAARALSNWNAKGRASDDQRLAMARAKVVGFLDSSTTVANTYPNSDKSMPARYARIITAYKSGAGISAIPVMADLVASAPSNPYFQELLGQMYVETGNPQKAIGPLATAVKLEPDAPLIRVLYAQALIATNNVNNINEAILQLKRAANEDSDSVLAYTFLSRAYNALGQMGDAHLAAAEAALGRGDKGVALGLARKAQENLTKGTPAWLRADDILSLNR